MGKHVLHKQAYTGMLILALLVFDCSRASAAYVPEVRYQEVEPYAYYYPQIIRCTCYCEHQGTATLKMPFYGCVAGKKDWLWDMCQLNAVNEDGSVGELIGFFEFRDTGAGMDTDGDGYGDSIKNGTSIDVWVESLDQAYAWRDKYGDYVYIKLIKAKG